MKLTLAKKLEQESFVDTDFEQQWEQERGSAFCTFLVSHFTDGQRIHPIFLASTILFPILSTLGHSAP
jgi:hypothetical protein